MTRGIILALWALVAGASLAAGQAIPDRYILELTSEPAIAPATDPAKGEARQAGPDRSARVRAEQTRVRRSLGGRKVEVTASLENVVNALVVHAPGQSAADLARIPGVKRVYKDRTYRLVLDRSVQLQKVLDGWNIIGGPEKAGIGVKIAIIDTGIDVDHPGFRDTGFEMPNGFPLVNKDTDRRYTNKKVIVARNYDNRAFSNAQDVQGHGTAVAMVAAGVSHEASAARISGVAPQAWLGSYKVFRDDSEGARTSDILRALEDAVSDGMDIVNLSLGGFPAERPADDILAQVVDRASAAGILVIVAAGNEGPGPNTIGSPATAASAIAVGNAANDRIFAALATPEGSAPYIVVPGDGPNSRTPIRAVLVDVQSLDPTALACGALPAGSLSGKTALILRGVCFFEDKLNNALRAGASAALVYTDAQRPAAESMGVGTARLPAAMLSNADGLDLKQRVADNSDLLITLNFNLSAVPVDSKQISNSSSRGPGVDFSVKPELLAVGSSVFTAAPVSNGAPAWTVISGTSFSSPMVAGAAAVVKSARRGLSPDQYRSLLVNSTTAFLTKDVSSLPIQQTGGGLLDLSASLRSTVVAAPAALNFGAGGNTMDIARSIRVTNLSTSSDTFTIAVASLGGSAPVVSDTQFTLEPGETRKVAVQLQGDGSGAAEHHGVVLIRGTRTDVETRIPYWYGVASNSAVRIELVEPPSSGRPGSTQSLLFRGTDAAGLPVSTPPAITSVTGGGAVLDIRSIDDEYPGFYEAAVRLGLDSGDQVFEIKMGSASTRVSISAP